MDFQPVKVTGLRELRQVFRIMYPELEKELNAGLKVIVADIANAARTEASIKGFDPPGTSGRGTGLLIGSIRSGVNLTKGWIKDTASNQGYAYPRRYEYEKDGARAFFRPAIAKNEDKIYGSIALLVERAINAANDAVL